MNGGGRAKPGFWLPLLAIALAAAAAPAVAQTEPLVRSDRSAATGQGPVTVTTEMGLVAIESAPGVRDATAGYLSYSLADAPSERPVLFIFNGGPGASASYLHMGALGPVRARVPQDPRAPLPDAAAIETDPQTLLDLADLVFIDPPGTGFSERAPDADAGFYNSVAGDADAAAQLVAQWLDAHGRATAPVFLLGESYGTIRAVAMLDALAERRPELRVEGVVLLGQALNMIETSQRPDNILSYVVSLPSLAAIACYHGKAVQPCEPDAISRTAARFAGTEYLRALFQGSAIAADEKRRVAERLEQLSGISADYYLANDLRISKERFRVELLRDEGLVVGRYDARYVAPRPADAGAVVGPDAFSAVSALYEGAMRAYLARDLGLADADAYKVIAIPEGSWAYGGGDTPFADWPFMESVERAMAREPALRLFVGTGIFDLTTTIGAADYLIAQSSIAPDRYRLERYPAGHVAYSDDASWRKLVGDLRSFLTAAAPHD
ncbi:S10 family serine carboxypeptidase-like protein [Sphingosinithalassobacter sp. LHW66-3]|uniref:S10 family serine carboxypeptidase-like protein n=1 Tax=Sphingosinithalassobacter sp. LHW66-3 TaxID=3424718 RepID=UPI003D6BC5F2